MSPIVGVIGTAALMVLLAARVPVAIGLILVSFTGITWMIGIEAALGVLSSTPYDFIASWTLSAIPMFLLMGFVCYHTGLTAGLFTAAKAVFARVPGGLAISAIFACAGFSTVSGSSIASAAAMGRVAIPEMIKGGYNANFAAGTIAAGGTLGALIPPSILMIIYGVLAETSVTKVFLGGIYAGLLTAVCYAIIIFLISIFKPSIVPQRVVSEDISLSTAFRGTWPVLLLIAIIFGGMFGGLFTSTEAAAIGAAGAMLIAAFYRKLSISTMHTSLVETLSTTASLFIIAVGAAMFTRFLGLSGTASLITGLFTGSELSYLSLILIIICVYLVLGMFMEPFGAMMVTLPIFLPILDVNGIDRIWFGVLLVKLLEVGMITPPLGMNVFVIQSVASRYVTLVGVFKGLTAFLIADAVIIAILVAWPDAVTWLTRIVN